MSDSPWDLRNDLHPSRAVMKTELVGQSGSSAPTIASTFLAPDGSADISPAFQRWVGGQPNSAACPVGAAEASAAPPGRMHGCFALLLPALKRWANLNGPVRGQETDFKLMSRLEMRNVK